MKKAFKFGFGVSLGVFAFNVCKTLVDMSIKKYFQKKFDEDLEFRLSVKRLSPELYAKYCKENTKHDFA